MRNKAFKSKKETENKTIRFPLPLIEKIEQAIANKGVLLLQGSDLHFVKNPTVRNVKEMQEIGIRALA